MAWVRLGICHGMAAWNLPWHGSLQSAIPPTTRPPGWLSAIPPPWATLVCWYETTSLVYPFGISTTEATRCITASSKRGRTANLDAEMDLSRLRQGRPTRELDGVEVQASMGQKNIMVRWLWLRRVHASGKRGKIGSRMVAFRPSSPQIGRKLSCSPHWCRARGGLSGGVGVEWDNREELGVVCGFIDGEVMVV
jgi:hypothetical protein